MRLYKNIAALLLVSMALLSACKDCNQCEVYRVDESEGLDTLSYVYPALCGTTKDLTAYEDRCLIEWKDTDSTDSQYYRCVCDPLD